MSKITLMIVGAAMTLMGVLALFPRLLLATEPKWHTIVKILVGIVCIIIAAMDKPKTSTTPSSPVTK